MKSRRVLYLDIVLVLTGCAIVGLQLYRHSARTEAAGASSSQSLGQTARAAGSQSVGWTLFGGIGSMAVRQAAPVTVASLENAQDLYASFLAARATGRPEFVYEAWTLINGCEYNSGTVARLYTPWWPPGHPEKEPWFTQNPKRLSAVQELDRRCRGFAVVRDSPALRWELWQQASSGDGPLGQLLRTTYGKLPRVSEPQVRDAIAAGLESGDRITIELGIQALIEAVGANYSDPFLAAAALKQASWNVFGENGMRQYDTEFRRTLACSAGLCIDSSQSYPPEEEQRRQDYYELEGIYERALASADVEAIIQARPSRSSRTTNEEKQPSAPRAVPAAPEK